MAFIDYFIKKGRRGSATTNSVDRAIELSERYQDINRAETEHIKWTMRMFALLNSPRNAEPQLLDWPPKKEEPEVIAKKMESFVDILRRYAKDIEKGGKSLANDFCGYVENVGNFIEKMTDPKRGYWTERLPYAIIISSAFLTSYDYRNLKNIKLPDEKYIGYEVSEKELEGSKKDELFHKYQIDEKLPQKSYGKR